MNSKRKISVIVCAYNTENYIKRCIESILNQTYDNIELILVDDHSNDNTLTIIKKYAKVDKRIKVIVNSKNMGLSHSRNIALKSATGYYVGFIDSDDYIPSNYYEILFRSCSYNDSEVAVCDINIVDIINGQNSMVKCGDDNNSKISFINNGLAASCCNKLFKYQVISKYQFSEGKVNEDLAVVLPIIINSKNIVYTSEVSYQYVQRKNSIQNSKISDKRFDIFYGVELTLKRIRNVENYDDYKDAIIFQQIIMLFIYVLTQEKKFLKRIKWFKKFAVFSRKYDLINNKYLCEYLESVGKIHKIYYKTLLKFEKLNMALIPSMLVSIYNILKALRSKNVIEKNVSMVEILKCAKKQSNLKEKISLTVIIPNYNYDKFLYQRIYSILSQKIKISEIIILDDCSSDNSRDTIKNIVAKINKEAPINIKYNFNEENSGSAFKQWMKGFSLAESEYVWIAEADDYCDKNFLKKVVRPIIKDNDIVISYSDTAFIDTTGNIIMKTIRPEIDLMKTNHWNKSYINTGKDEFNNYTFLNCTIANVSSAIIKKQDYDKFFKISGEYKQAGDWLFYANVMQTGKIAYTNKTLNYYRVHGNNVSSTTKKENHMKEIKKIHEYYKKNYGLNEFQKKQIEKRYAFLNKVWKLNEK